ncbi:hypothetical protein ACFBZI_11750 [Moraxella sp. ZJ142]|uniref:hypothetical protein n=1 Tax=Moraxella marmotae TaxID=3344520 RepID=UPI0035D4D814
MNIQTIKAQALANFNQVAINSQTAQKLHQTRSRNSAYDLLGFDPVSLSAVYITERGDASSVLMYSRKTIKNPQIHTVRGDNSKLLQIANDFINKHKELATAKKAAKTSAPSADAMFKIGDVFAYFYGYECTKWDFFQVVGFSGKQTIQLREIHAKLIKQERHGDYIAPAVNDFKSDKIISKKAQKLEFGNRSHVYLKMDNHFARVVDANDTFLETPY